LPGSAPPGWATIGDMSLRRLCILVDLENYSRLDGNQQYTAQRVLASALAVAADKAGLRRPKWQRQLAGDGELAVLPVDELQAQVVGAFPLALDAQLREQEGRDGLLLRVRMAMVYGVVTESELGYSDHAVVAVARMADAAPVRRALALVPEARLVLALSTELFRDVIRHGDAALTAAHFIRVPIDRMEGDAWITVPDVDPRQLVDESQPAPDTDRTEGYRAVINGGVSGHEIQFGHRFG
jgi:hypothetical protein